MDVNVANERPSNEEKEPCFRAQLTQKGFEPETSCMRICHRIHSTMTTPLLLSQWSLLMNYNVKSNFIHLIISMWFPSLEFILRTTVPPMCTWNLDIMKTSTYNESFQSSLPSTSRGEQTPWQPCQLDHPFSGRLMIWLIMHAGMHFIHKCKKSVRK